MLRYNAESFTKLMALNRHVKFPGIPIYLSRKLITIMMIHVHDIRLYLHKDVFIK